MIRSKHKGNIDVDWAFRMFHNDAGINGKAIIYIIGLVKEKQVSLD